MEASPVIQNCFYLPDGLRELMSDISREVLRVQPVNLYVFIADYLSALLVTREHVAVASRVCACLGEKELVEKLKDVGLNEEEITDAIEIISKHLDKPQVKESDVLHDIMETMSIQENQIQHIQDAVRAAHCQYKLRREDTVSRLSQMDEVEAALKHTLDLYVQTKPSDEEYNQMAGRIQAAYKAYGVKRQMHESSSSSDSWFFENGSFIRSTSSEDNSNDTNTNLFYTGYVEPSITEEYTDFTENPADSKVKTKLVDKQKSKDTLSKSSKTNPDRNVTFHVAKIIEINEKEEEEEEEEEHVESAEESSHQQTVEAMSLQEMDYNETVDEDPFDIY